MRMLYVCGSFRFMHEMEELERLLEEAKIEYLMSKSLNDRGIIGCLEKIDLSDVVYVVNPEGYVGRSVCVDIGYALARKKPIYSMRPIEDPPVTKLMKSILSFEELIDRLKPQ